MVAKKGMKSPRLPRKLLDFQLVFHTPTDADQPPERFNEGQKTLWRIKKKNEVKFLDLWRQEEDRQRARAAKATPTKVVDHPVSGGPEQAPEKPEELDLGTEQCVSLIDRFLAAWKEGKRE